MDYLDTREIRFGNIVEVKVNGDWEQTSIWGFYGNGQFARIDDGKTSPLTAKDYRPIPLTEKWLRRFSLINDDPKHKANFKGGFMFYVGRFRFTNSVSEGFNNHELSLTIKYVHQLQNLYFALTGEELAVKTA